MVYIGNDGGLYRSTNRGTNWQALNRGLAITELEYIAQDAGQSRWILGGTQDNGSIRYTGSNVWDHVADGDGGDCTVNTVTPDTVFHSFFRMGVERSTDRGQTWTWLPTASRDPAVYRAALLSTDGKSGRYRRAGWPERLCLAEQRGPTGRR